MNSERWVRIVDPEHVCRSETDEVWSAGDAEKWFNVVWSEGRKLREVYGGKVRCRLRDVPPGTNIVDPGEGYELVEPWETEPTGDEEYWMESDREWRKRTGPHLCLWREYIYRRPIAKSVSKTPQPGEWWFANDGSGRAYMHAFDQFGKVIYEFNKGPVYSVEIDWSTWHHEPACTGWDWQPPQPEAEPEPLTLEQRVEVMEQRLKKLEYQVSEWEDSH